MRNSHKKDSQFKLIGSSIPRKEDDRLLKGGGKFTDDVQIPHQLEMAVGRSPFPHAMIIKQTSRGARGGEASPRSTGGDASWSSTARHALHGMHMQHVA